MTNFLTRWTGRTPAISETAAATRREEFASAVAAFRQATGKAETRVIPCRCAVTGESFAILFERMSPAHRFQIARIERNEAAGSEGKNSHGVIGRKAPQHSYDAGEFDWAGCACPHCGNRAGVVYCNGCGDTVCAGRVRPLPDGGKVFACHDGCGATGATGPATHVRGGAGESRLAIGHSPRLPGPSTAQTALPGSAAGAAPGRRHK